MVQAQEKLKKTELKLRQLQATKLKDLQRSIREKDQTINALNKKISELLEATKTKFDTTNASRAISGSRHQGLRNNSVMRGRDVGSRSHNRGGMYGGSITSRGIDNSRSPSNARLDHSIQEVEETFEMSGYDFANQNMYRGGNYDPEPDDWHNRN